MVRILVAECRQEVSTFNPAPSRYQDYVVSFGDDIVAYHRGLRTELGGALAVLAGRQEIEIVPTSSHRAITSGGTLTGADWARIAAEFAGSIQRALGGSQPPDAAFFGFHGAMVAEDEEDPEGFLLAEARRLLGERVPIVVTLDLHGIVTDRMLRLADAVVAYHTYPHNDFFETGERGGRLLLKLLDRRVRPTTAMVRIPALVRGDELITASGLIGDRIRECQRIEAEPGGLSAAMFWGNPFTDVPDLCSNSLVVTDDDPARARREAVALAEAFWADRARMQADLVDLTEAGRLAKDALGAGTVVLVDAADAPSSGASGDSNAVLRAMVEQGYPGRCLFPIVDAPAVHAAAKAGVGATIRTLLGGSVDPGRFMPFPVEATVRMLADGRHVSESHGIDWFAGDTAVLELIPSGHVVIATSRPVSLYDRSLFLGHGQDPRRFDAVVQKSPHARHDFFAAWAHSLVGVDAPGSTSANLPSLGHTRCRRPIYPLDPNATFTPEPLIFQRH